MSRTYVLQEQGSWSPYVIVAGEIGKRAPRRGLVTINIDEETLIEGTPGKLRHIHGSRLVVDLEQ